VTFDKDETRIYGNDGASDKQVLTDSDGRIITSTEPDATSAWTPIHDGDTDLMLGIPAVILTYTPTGSRRLRTIILSSDRAGVFTLHVASIQRLSVRTVSDAPTIVIPLGNGILIPDAALVSVTFENQSNQGNAEADATIMVST